MFFEVPQYIDIEDKVAFQLTAKQLGWFALGGVLIFLAWSIFEKSAFIFITILIIVVSLIMAFIRPYGLSMSAFISHGILYFLKPKKYIWQKSFFHLVETESETPEQLLKKKQLQKEFEQKKANRKNFKVDKMADLLDNIQQI